MDTFKRDLSRVAVLALIFLGAMTAPLWGSGLTQKNQDAAGAVVESAAESVTGTESVSPALTPVSDTETPSPTLLPADGAIDYATDPAARAPDYLPRPADEWQGMLVDLNMRALCNDTATCGLGQTCNDEGLCSACSSDMQCMAGEMCVLDHCVPQQNVTCRSSSDCGEGELCALNGYSADLRGTAGTVSYCLADTGGQTAVALQDADYPEPELPGEEPDADSEGSTASDTVVAGQILRPDSVRQQLQVKTLLSSDLPDRIED